MKQLTIYDQAQEEPDEIDKKVEKQLEELRIKLKQLSIKLRNENKRKYNIQ